MPTRSRVWVSPADRRCGRYAGSATHRFRCSRRRIAAWWRCRGGRHDSAGEICRMLPSALPWSDFIDSRRQPELQAKLLIYNGGPGRTRTSNQAVMSASGAPRNPQKIDISGRNRMHSLSFGSGVLLASHWSNCHVRVVSLMAKLRSGPQKARRRARVPFGQV